MCGPMAYSCKRRMEDHGECMLVPIGATPKGKKELLGFRSPCGRAQSWRELLIDVKQRGLQIAPEIAVGDGALGFWKVLDEVFPGTPHQRCWVHKTVNVLDKVPLSVQANVKGPARGLLGAGPGGAEAAIDVFADKYRAKYGQRSNASPGTAMRCWPCTTSLLSIGITCARRVRWTSDF